MTDLETVRTIINDSLQYGVTRLTTDGYSTEYRYEFAPIYPGTAKIYLAGTLKTLTTDYTLDETLGLVTMVSVPAASLELKISGKYTMLTDDQINGLLTRNSDSADPVSLAAATALDIIASSEALIQKKLKMLDFETDGAAVAKSLRDHAKSLRDLVFNSGENDFDIVERIDTQSAWTEKIVKDIIKES